MHALSIGIAYFTITKGLILRHAVKRFTIISSAKKEEESPPDPSCVSLVTELFTISESIPVGNGYLFGQAPQSCFNLSKCS